MSTFVNICSCYTFTQIMSKRHQFIQYLIDLADQGIVHGIPELRERVQQLLCLIPSGGLILF